MKNSIVLFVCFALFNSCQLFNPKPETEDFFCRINGKVFRPEAKSLSLGTPLSSTLSKKDGSFSLSAWNGNCFIGLSLKLEVQTNLKIGKYELVNKITGNNGVLIFDRNNSNAEQVLSDSGFLNINKVEGSLISGTFEFEGYSKVKKKTCKIKLGQFNDVTLNTF